MILLNFQIFTLVRKKHSIIFVHSDLKCLFKVPWVLYYCSILFSSSLSTSNTSLFAGCSSICVPNVCDKFVPTTILTLQTQPSLPYWMAITLPIGHLFLLISSHNKTMYPTLKFLTFLFHLWQTCKVAKTSFFHLLQNSFAKCCTHLHSVSYNICLLSGTPLGVV